MTHERVITNFQILEKWKDEGHKIALWIGRAKLPHIGHISYLKALWEKGYKLVIANGSCYTINSDNPIQVFEVQAMLALSLRLEGVPADDLVEIKDGSLVVKIEDPELANKTLEIIINSSLKE